MKRRHFLGSSNKTTYLNEQNSSRLHPELSASIHVHLYPPIHLSRSKSSFITYLYYTLVLLVLFIMFCYKFYLRCFIIYLLLFIIVYHYLFLFIFFITNYFYLSLFIIIYSYLFLFTVIYYCYYINYIYTVHIDTYGSTSIYRSMPMPPSSIYLPVCAPPLSHKLIIAMLPSSPLDSKIRVISSTSPKMFMNKLVPVEPRSTRPTHRKRSFVEAISHSCLHCLLHCQFCIAFYLCLAWGLLVSPTHKANVLSTLCIR